MVLIAIFGVIICSVYIYFKYVLYAYWDKRGVPYVEPTVPFGNLFPAVSKQKYLGDIYADQYHKYKKLGIFGMYTFYKPSLVIADPDLIRFVMTKEFPSFHDRGMYCNPQVDPLSDNLFMLPGPKWKNLRAKLTQTFTSGKMKRMFDVVNKRGIELSTFFERNLNGELDLREVFARYTTDVIVSTAMGIDCNSLADPNSEFRNFGRQVFKSRPIRNACLVFAPGILNTFKIPFTPKSVQTFFLKAFEESVSYRKKNNVSCNDFMDLLMQLMNKGDVDGDDEDNDAVPHISEDSSGKISSLEAAAQAFIFFIAGFETSSSLAAHCIYEMALNEEIQNKCRQDIKEGFARHGGKLTYESLNDMPYLHKVIHEGMRKYPALGGLIRVCTKPIVLPTGLRVDKGMDIVIPVGGLHSDPDYYPRPEIFDPERFTPEEIAKRHPYTYLPFGEGPRICIALRFGLMQTKIAVVYSLMKYRFLTTPRTPKKLKIDPGALVAVPDCPIFIRVQSLQ